MSRKELTPSEYEEMVSTKKTKSSIKPGYIKYGVMAVITLVLCGVSFGLGMNHQKGKQTGTSLVTANGSGQFPAQGGGPGGFGGRDGFRNGQRPSIGEVTAVSSDSITIQDSRSNSKQTFKITSDTTVQDNGSPTSVSEIKTGDTAVIITNSSDASTANQIMLNPNFQQGPQSNSSI